MQNQETKLMRKSVNADNRKILYLTNNDNTLALYEWLKERADANICRERLSLVRIKEQKPDMLISYNYRYIISKEIIEYMNGNVINLHGSYLPWNRGSAPNFWSFFDDTPKGVTIHQINEKLDQGSILYQKECQFCAEEETFASSYEKLQKEMITLFQEHWEEIKRGSYHLKEQKGKGSYHSIRDLQAIREKVGFEWTDNVADFLMKYKNAVRSG